ncbi:MAG: hypothetical protein IKT77_05850, partial [Paludibacteraceae bacterium]|nr:hypothetical protein [Paludibacteraceae bacterium]
ATLGNLSKLNCPRLSQDFSDFLPFFHLRFKDRWFGFNNSLFDYVKLLPSVVIIASFGIVQAGLTLLSLIAINRSTDDTDAMRRFISN